MGAGYVIPEDPSRISNRFVSFEDPLIAAEELAEEEAAADFLSEYPEYEAQIYQLLQRIPQKEADLIELYYLKKKKQADIAAIFDITQAAVSYRLVRGLRRIKFLLSIPCLTLEGLEQNLPIAFEDPIDVQILIGMWQTTCQSAVAISLNLTQGLVRHRFFKAVTKLQEKSKEDIRLKPYSEVFSAIADKNFNALHEVILPQWSNRGNNACI